MSAPGAPAKNRHTPHFIVLHAGTSRCIIHRLKLASELVLRIFASRLATLNYAHFVAITLPGGMVAKASTLKRNLTDRYLKSLKGGSKPYDVAIPRFAAYAFA